MNILFYAILFIIGLLIGIFWAIKSIEIPKSLDMKKVHYNKYTNEEITSKITYVFLGGLITVILANIFNIDIYEFDLFNMIIYIFAMLYITTLVLVSGIDRVYVKIEKKMIGFGIISSIVYMIYLSAIDLASIHLSGIYVLIYIILLILDTLILRKYAKDSYIINILLLLNIILSYTDLRVLTYTSIMAFIAIVVYVFIQHIQKKKYGNKKIKLNEIPVGYFIAASNIIILFMIRIFENYYI